MQIMLTHIRRPNQSERKEAQSLQCGCFATGTVHVFSRASHSSLMCECESSGVATGATASRQEAQSSRQGCYRGDANAAGVSRPCLQHLQSRPHPKQRKLLPIASVLASQCAQHQRHSTLRACHTAPPALTPYHPVESFTRTASSLTHHLQA